MNIRALGAIGELVGAIAIIASFVFAGMGAKRRPDGARSRYNGAGGADTAF